MKAALAIAVVGWVAVARAGEPCLAPGEPIHWVADYCMLKMETDDEIAVAGCIEAEMKADRPASTIVRRSAGGLANCPRLPVWEEANRRAFIVHIHEPGQPALVAVSPLGLAQLAARRAQQVP